MATPRLRAYGWLSVAASIGSLGLKGLGVVLSGSVAVLSDALESVVNVVAAAVLVLVLRWAEAPEDDDHAFGHGKAHHLAAAFEALLICVAAVFTAIAAVERLVRPVALEALGWGMAAVAGGLLVNLVAGLVLVRAGKRHHAQSLEADGHHLISDVVTSVAVLVGLGLVAWTGVVWLDAAFALAVTGWVGFVGSRLLKEAIAALVDAQLPADERAKVDAVLEVHRREGLSFHALRTRRSGPRRFVELHVLVPGAWSVKQGHDLCETLEREVGALFEQATVLTHLEPVEDPASYVDQRLDR